MVYIPVSYTRYTEQYYYQRYYKYIVQRIRYFHKRAYILCRPGRRCWTAVTGEGVVGGRRLCRRDRTGGGGDGVDCIGNACKVHNIILYYVCDSFWNLRCFTDTGDVCCLVAGNLCAFLRRYLNAYFMHIYTYARVTAIHYNNFYFPVLGPPRNLYTMSVVRTIGFFFFFI